MVPEEPTEAMLENGVKALDGNGAETPCTSDAEFTYKAMIAAYKVQAL
jgi:hypothetical protein